MIKFHCGEQRTVAEWLDWQEKSHPKAWDLGLQRIGAVWQRLNPTGAKIAPHIITVAGTNGKGSCVRWTEEICRAHGIRVAAFSSPHLRNYRERIRFDGQWIDEDALVAAFAAIDAARGEISLTYFEWSALAMFYLTQQRQPEVVVLEVGLGGRLDATNLISADVAIITRIGLDHQDWLGNERETIAREKAGIMRAGQRVFITDDHPPAALAQCGHALGAQLFFYGQDFRVEEMNGQLHLQIPHLPALTLPIPVHMAGKHQFAHLAATLSALAPWFALRPERLATVTQTTQNDGRLMLIAGAPRLLLDVAHNVDSAEVLATFIAGLPRAGRVLAVCGMLKDKDQRGILHCLAPWVDEWFFAALAGERGSSAELLANNAQVLADDTPRQFLPHVASALCAAKAAAAPEDLIVIFGSFVTVFAALEELNL